MDTLVVFFSSNIHDCFKNGKVVLALNKLHDDCGCDENMINFVDSVGEILDFHSFLIAMVQFLVTNNEPIALTNDYWIFEPFQNTLDRWLVGKVRRNFQELAKLSPGLSNDAKRMMRNTINRPHRYVNTSMGFNEIVRKTILVEPHRTEVAKLFSFQFRYVGEESAYEYIVEVRMELYLVHNIPKSYKDFRSV